MTRGERWQRDNEVEAPSAPVPRDQGSAGPVQALPTGETLASAGGAAVPGWAQALRRGCGGRLGILDTGAGTVRTGPQAGGEMRRGGRESRARRTVFGLCHCLWGPCHDTVCVDVTDTDSLLWL